MIYFIRRENNCGPVKIGLSNNIKQRLSHLKTGSPFQMELIGLLSGDREKERELHARFGHLRIPGGEWFKSSPELSKFIEKNCAMPLITSTNIYRCPETIMKKAEHDAKKLLERASKRALCRCSEKDL